MARCVEPFGQHPLSLLPPADRDRGISPLRGGVAIDKKSSPDDFVERALQTCVIQLESNKLHQRCFGLTTVSTAACLEQRAAENHQEDQDQNDQSDSAARTVAPVAAVTPGGHGADEHQNQKDQ